MEKVAQFFKAHPEYAGILFAGIGVLFLLAAINNWQWFFEGRSWNLGKIEGLSNFFGRGFARIAAGIGGVVLIIAGVVWFSVYAFLK
jgi:hypothetical protein